MGRLFRNHLGTFLGGFAANLGDVSVFEAEVTGLIVALEFAASHGWDRLWLESDSTAVVHAFHNPYVILFRFRNQWHNCALLGINSICSHAFHEGNYCADKLANFGHSVLGTVWLDSLPPVFVLDFFRDCVGLPNYRFP